MEINEGHIENRNTFEEPASYFNERHSLAIRIWHWTFFLVITSTLITVLFASTLFTTGGNISLVQEQIQHKGGDVTPEHARSVAHAFNDKLWNLHKWIGFVICFLLLSRLAIEISLSREEKLRMKIKKAFSILMNKNAKKGDSGHYLLVKSGYLIFYILILIMALTGLGLAFENVPFLKSIHKSIVSVHTFTQYLIYFYILSHLVGVIRADLTNNKGIVSRMINGKLS